MIGLGTVMAQMADRMTPARAGTVPQQQVAVVEETAPAPAYGRTLNIPHDARGHFATEGRINGQRIDFMVDTGASVIALNETSAAQFGFRPTPGDYTSKVTTANGTIKAARTRIAMVEVGGLVVRDVDGMMVLEQ
jgi:aspartyl protease family protein